MKSSKMLIPFAFLALCTFTATTSFVPTALAAPQAKNSAASLQEYFTLRDGTKVWVEADIINPAQRTKLVFNGLTNSTDSFNVLADDYVGKGLNVIRFDFLGQAKTLMANDKENNISYTRQVDLVAELVPLVEHRVGFPLNIDVLGQSYGGGIMLAMATQNPEFATKLRSITAFAPYTEPLKAQDEQIKDEIKFWKELNLKYSDQQLYDMIFYRTVMSSYPIYEPEIIGSSVLETKVRLEGVYALATGIRPYNAGKVIGNLPPNLKINIVISANDQYIPDGVIKAYWNALPASNRGYFITLFGTEHKMLQTLPRMSANISELTANPPLDKIPYGAEFEVYFATGRIRYGVKRFILEDLLREKGLLQEARAHNYGASVVACSKVFAN